MGKKTNKERRRLREERQAAQRRAERRRNLVTLGLVVGIMAVGGVLVWISLEPEAQPQPNVEDGQDGGSDADDGQSGADDDQSGEAEPDGADEGGQSGGNGAGGTGPGGTTSGTGGQQEVATDDREVACGASVPDSAAEDKPTFEQPEQVLEGVEDPRARLVTSCGEVVLDLDVERAPQAANSFAFLAQQGFFEGLRFFRSRPGMGMVQTGAGDDRGTWDIGYTLAGELQAAQEDGYPPGAVALAVPEADPDGGGSQFFIVYGEQFMDAVIAGGLERIYPRFATVTEGLDVVRRIGGIDVVESGDQHRPAQQVFIESVEIEPA